MEVEVCPPFLQCPNMEWERKMNRKKFPNAVAVAPSFQKESNEFYFCFRKTEALNSWGRYSIRDSNWTFIFSAWIDEGPIPVKDEFVSLTPSIIDIPVFFVSLNESNPDITSSLNFPFSDFGEGLFSFPWKLRWDWILRTKSKISTSPLPKTQRVTDSPARTSKYLFLHSKVSRLVLLDNHDEKLGDLRKTE